jgi:predicted unusual protein kinase regulating ubiquinone biosynthesis (AarF/ABC1/UbiB family)
MLKIFKIFKQIVFLVNILYIFGIEFFIYYIFNDFSNFIERLTIRLSKVNILYVKLFQAFALNNSLIDEKINNKLLKFTDNVPWSHYDIDLLELIEICDNFEIILKADNITPINSGMISVVFKATRKYSLHPVIIKMKRKNIEQKLNDGIDNLLFVIYLLSFIPIINKYNIAEVINKNIEIIRNQTNFLEEVDNMNRIRNNCKHLKYVKIPITNRIITEEYPNCIIMEYIEGIKINQIHKEDYEGFAKQIMKFGFVTTIIHGVTHGDLHAGNVLFIKDNNDKKYPYKIGVIDFGIIYEINTEYKCMLFDVLTQMFELEPRESAIKILNSGIIDPPGIIQQIPKEDYENIILFTADIIHETINTSKKANQLQLYKFISKLNDYLSNSMVSNIGIRPSDNFIKTQLVLAMAHGITLTLCEDDFINLADKVINELFHANMIM